MPAASLFATLVLLAVQPPTLKAGRGAEEVVLDGRLTESVWQDAESIAGLTQVEPVQGGPADGVTAVKVLAHPRYLVLGVAVRTTRPIVAFARARDASLRDEDHVRFVFDPFGDGRSGYLFAVNPFGARYDALVSNQGEGENAAWDALWEAAAAVTDSGWSVEIRVPVKSLSFPAGADRWVMNVQRRVQGALATERWAAPRQDQQFGQTTNAGWLTGLPRFDLGQGLTIRPAVVAGAARAGPSVPSDGQFELSADVEKRLGANLLGTVTVNTDFAETEVDARQANLTRFPLFFPEKRAFFLEGSDVFEFGLGLRTDLVPFFSRRIGLFDEQRIPIQAGAKLNGQVGSTRIGAILTRTGSVDTVGATELAVVRVRQNLLRESSVGLMATAGDPAGGFGWLAGADATYRNSRFRGGKNLLAGAWFLATDRPGAAGDRTAVGAMVDYPNDQLDLAVSWKRLGDGFDPPLGFVPRRGVHLVKASANIQPRPGRWGIRQMFFENQFSLATDLRGRWESYQVFLAPVNWRLESGDRFEFNVVPQGERLVEPFEVATGVVIAPGAYRPVRYRLEWEFAARRRLSGQLTWRWGGFYGGRLEQYQFRGAWRPGAALAVEVNGEVAHGRLPEGRFTTTVTGVRVRYNASPNLAFNTLVQYDSESETVGSNTRIRWTISPAAEAFLIYNHNVRDRLDRWSFESNQLLGKVQVAFRR